MYAAAPSAAHTRGMACGCLLRSRHAASNARRRYTTQGVHTSLPMDRCCRCVLQPQLKSRIHTGTHAHARTLHRAWSRRMFAPKSRSASANSLMSRSPLPVAITSCSIGTQSYRSDPIDELLDGMVASTLSTLRGPSSNARHLPSASTWRKYSIRNRSCHYGEYSRVPLASHRIYAVYRICGRLRSARQCRAVACCTLYAVQCMLSAVRCLHLAVSSLPEARSPSHMGRAMRGVGRAGRGRPAFSTFPLPLLQACR